MSEKRAERNDESVRRVYASRNMQEDLIKTKQACACNKSKRSAEFMQILVSCLHVCLFHA